MTANKCKHVIKTICVSTLSLFSQLSQKDLDKSIHDVDGPYYYKIIANELSQSIITAHIWIKRHKYYMQNKHFVLFELKNIGETKDFAHLRHFCSLSFWAKNLFYRKWYSWIWIERDSFYVYFLSSQVEIKKTLLIKKVCQGRDSSNWRSACCSGLGQIRCLNHLKIQTKNQWESPLKTNGSLGRCSKRTWSRTAS